MLIPSSYLSFLGAGPGVPPPQSAARTVGCRAQHLGDAVPSLQRCGVYRVPAGLCVRQPGQLPGVVRSVCGDGDPPGNAGSATHAGTPAVQPTRELRQDSAAPEPTRTPVMYHKLLVILQRQ